jgi:hypothetical protein
MTHESVRSVARRTASADAADSAATVRAAVAPPGASVDRDIVVDSSRSSDVDVGSRYSRVATAPSR